MLPFKVRLATLEDVEGLVVLSREFFEESKLPYEFSFDKTWETLECLINDQGSSLVALAEDEGVPIAMIIGSAVQPSMSLQRVSSELAFYILPEYRGTEMAFDLLATYEYWAKHVAKCKFASVACLENLHPDKVEKLYNGIGYKRTERAYIKEL